MKRAILALTVLALTACEPAREAVDDGAACFGEGARAERLAACTAIIEDSERSVGERAGAYANRAGARELRGEVTAALRDYEAALALEEGNVAALLGRAGILVDSGQLDAAEPLLARAAQVDRSGKAQYLLGRIALQRSDYAEAITRFDAALQQAPELAAAMSGRARARQRSGDPTGARADYEAAIRLDGALAEARAGRCWLNLTEERDLERARNDAEAAVAADPRNVQAQLCRGVLQLRGGEWANARATFDAALAVEPGNPVALFGRGVARRRSGDDSGREDMNLARDFDRHVGEAYDEWGVETF